MGVSHSPYPADQGRDQISQRVRRRSGLGSIGVVPTGGPDAELIACHDFEGDPGAYFVASRAAADLDHIIIWIGGRVGWVARRKGSTGRIQIAVIEVFQRAIGRFHRGRRVHIGLLFVC